MDLPITNKSILDALRVPMKACDIVYKLVPTPASRHHNRVNMLLQRLRNKGKVKDHDFVSTEIKEGEIVETITKGVVAA